MDINVNVNMNESAINGLFNQVEEMKRQRLNLKEQIDYKTDEIIAHIIKNGNVLAFKNNVPHILTVSGKATNQFNRAQLSSDTGVSESDLNLVGIAELVEGQRTSSEQLKDYYQVTTKTVLKARKAKKSDMELLRSRSH